MQQEKQTMAWASVKHLMLFAISHHTHTPHTLNKNIAKRKRRWNGRRWRMTMKRTEGQRTFITGEGDFFSYTACLLLWFSSHGIAHASLYTLFMQNMFVWRTPLSLYLSPSLISLSPSLPEQKACVALPHVLFLPCACMPGLGCA